MTQPKKIAIVGGGIAGLSAAWHLQSLAPESQIVLFESSQSLGGMLQTESVDGFLIENSGDMFTTEPSPALDLCERLGRADELIHTQPVEQRAVIATPTGYSPVPKGFSLMLPNDLLAIASSDLLDAAGKARFLEEENVASKSNEADESLQSFAVRRYGQQVFERLIQPLVSGIYTADPQRLSIRATMMRFVDMERKHGSLIAAAKHAREKAHAKFDSHVGATDQKLSDRNRLAEENASGARYDLFRAPKNGMGQLPKWIVDDFQNVEIRTSTTVEAIEHDPANNRWTIATGGASGKRSETFDGVVIAAPVKSASKLLNSVDANLANELSAIESASCAVVVLAFEESQFQHCFDGYGIVVPSYLGRKLIAASFSSNKFAGRSPDGKILIRCFIGGALQSELVDRSDDELYQIAFDELNQLLGINGSIESAIVRRIFRWRNAMPQYHVGHLDRVGRIESSVAELSGIELAGNGYRGVGIPVCISSGKEAAERIAKTLGTLELSKS